LEDKPEVSSTMGRNEAWNVLEEAPRRAELLRDPDDLPEEPAALSPEPGAVAGDAEVLAGEAAGEEINTACGVAPVPLLMRIVGATGPKSTLLVPAV
jgi:hypothetical protein